MSQLILALLALIATATMPVATSDDEIVQVLNLDPHEIELLALNQKIYEFLPPAKTKFIERISALVGEEYTTRIPNSPRLRVIGLTLIEASVVAFRELYARSIDFNPSSTRTTQVDDKKFAEYYKRNIIEPCQIVLELYEDYKYSIEKFLSRTKEIPHFTSEGRLRVWAGDCKFLVEKMIEKDILDELKMHDPRHHTAESGSSSLGSPRHYLRRSESYKVLKDLAQNTNEN